MSAFHPNLDKVLYGELQPWLQDNVPDESYTPKISSIRLQENAVQLKYELSFPRPFNSKTKYYRRLIENAIEATVQNSISLMKEDEDEEILLCYTDEFLYKNLKTKLLDISEIIAAKDYYLAYLKNSYVPQPSERNHHTNTYIMQFLRLAYMQIYLEIQEEFIQHIEDIFIPEDFYTQLFREPIPGELPLRRIKFKEVIPNNKKQVSNNKHSAQSDRPSFTYKKYNHAPQNLTNLHNNFIRNGWIDAETSLAAFKRIFSGKDVLMPVKWTGNKSELYYFVKTLHSKKELVEYVGQRIWEITCNCFVDKDGKEFDRKKFKDTKDPKLSVAKIDKSIKLLE